MLEITSQSWQTFNTMETLNVLGMKEATLGVSAKS
jgi:hypothetical protein